MRFISTAAGVAIVLGLVGCSTHNQETAKEEAREDTRKATDEAKKAVREIKDETAKLSQRVGDAVQPDAKSASDKLSDGTDRMKDAASRAGIKLDHAALIAKIKTRLASDAGLTTLTNVEVKASGSVVTLSGTVKTAEQMKAVEVAASQVDGVTSVHNNLIVQP